MSFTMVLTSMALLGERNEGLIERSWVAGVNAAEIIIAQIATYVLTIIVQLVLILVVMIYGFKVSAQVSLCFLSLIYIFIIIFYFFYFFF